jgi:hypothetical protein
MKAERQEELMALARLSQGTRVCVLLSMAREAGGSGVGEEARIGAVQHRRAWQCGVSMSWSGSLVVSTDANRARSRVDPQRGCDLRHDQLQQVTPALDLRGQRLRVL